MRWGRCDGAWSAAAERHSSDCRGLQGSQATHTLSSWLALCYISRSPINSLHCCAGLGAAGHVPLAHWESSQQLAPDLILAQHVLFGQTKWVFTIIQVSHIQAGGGLELCCKWHLSEGLGEFGGGSHELHLKHFLKERGCIKYIKLICITVKYLSHGRSAIQDANDAPHPQAVAVHHYCIRIKQLPH